ncbi:MAG TPA: macrolide family glycosyltransferase [Herpetosiphonaceae bacterium]
MSTIVYLTPPAHGHVNPTLPVVQELVQRGERVLCYNTEEFRPQLERTSATFRPYPSMAMTAPEISRLLQRGSLARMTGLILRTTEQLVPFLRAAIQRDQPDLIIFDSIALWGRIVARQLGLPAVASISHFIMDERHLRPRDMLRLIGQTLPHRPAIMAARRRLRRIYGNAYPAGSPLFPLRDQRTIVFTSRELQPDTTLIDETFRFVGPAIHPQTRPEEDFPFDALGTDPIVYVSLGTIHTAQPAFVRTCFAAFAGVRAQVVLSLGKHTPISALGPIPSNFLVRPSVPQLDIVQRAAVFITHAGMNSIQEGLYYGVPLILIPQHIEQLFNARIVAGQGAGILLDHHLRHTPLPAQVLRQTLDQVMAERRYRDAAVGLQQILRATGGYHQAATEIQAALADGAARRSSPIF